VFGIGPSELVIILVIALLVLGPKRLPELAAGLGKGLAEFRRATSDINAELDEARRSVEEQTREAAKASQPDRRVSRTQRAPSKPFDSPRAIEADKADGDQQDQEDQDEQDESDTTPKAPA